MKSLNIRDESTDTNAKTTNNSSKWTSSARIQDLSEEVKEAKQPDTQTPNPKKAPLNYIDNMWEWEAAQKKYVNEINEKQQELASIIWIYEDKWNEIERFRIAKSDLEIRLTKIIWRIVNKLKEYEDFLWHVYSKIDEHFPEESYSEANEEINDEEVDGEINYEENNNIWQENSNDLQENQDEEVSKGITEILSAIWLDIPWVGIIINWQEDTTLDEANTIINYFLDTVNRKNRDEYKGYLDKTEISWMENLYNLIKKYCEIYSDLRCQIDIMDGKISKLEREESEIYSKFCGLKKGIEWMAENMWKKNETYFLNSYLSTKNVSLDSFVSSPIVEKQIANIIESNRNWETIPKTILLYGKPNLWKTYAANVLATELWRKMYHIRSYDIFTGWFSDPNKMLDEIFDLVTRKEEPCIIFLDEIEDFASWYNWSPYQNLLENTIRHHISKIKESKDTDIIIIWAISEKNKVSPSLLKQDVFSKQIYFDVLPEHKCVDFINKIATENWVKIGNDVDIAKLVNIIKDSDRNQEYFKKLINMAIDSHKLNCWKNDNISLSMLDFNDAIKYMSQYNRNTSQSVWF